MCFDQQQCCRELQANRGTQCHPESPVELPNLAGVSPWAPRAIWRRQAPGEQGLGRRVAVEEGKANGLLQRDSVRLCAAQPSLQRPGGDAVEIGVDAFVVVQPECGIEPGEQGDSDDECGVVPSDIVGRSAVDGASGVHVLPALLCDDEADQAAIEQVSGADTEESVGMPARARAVAAPVEGAVSQAIVDEPEGGEAGGGDMLEGWQSEGGHAAKSVSRRLLVGRDETR